MPVTLLVSWRRDEHGGLPENGSFAPLSAKGANSSAAVYSAAFTTWAI